MNSKVIKQVAAGSFGKTRREEGFTLIETSVALVVMMIVGLGAASLFFYAVSANSTARDRELSMAVAQQQMERLRNTEFLDMQTVVNTTGGANKTEISADRGYTVATTIANTFAGNDSLKTITVQVTPLGDTPLAGITSVFGGVTLVTIRSSTGVGLYAGP